MSIERSEGHFRSYDQTELYFQVWRAPKTRAFALITHGIGEHSDRYHRVAQELAQVDISSLGWDLRGHGRSEGQRGYVRDFDDYLMDQQSIVEFASQELFPNTKSMIQVAHSMGALITLSSTALEKTAALCLSSPLVDIALKVPWVKDKLAHFLYDYFPKLTLYNEIRAQDLTRDSIELSEIAKDPLRHEKVSASIYLGVKRLTAALPERAKTIVCPTLFLLSGKDKLVSTEAAVRLFDLIDSARKKRIIYEESYHEVFNDLDRELVFSDLRNFLRNLQDENFR